MPPRQSVRGAVAERDSADRDRTALDEQVRKQKGWFRQLVPAHVNPDQFAAIIIGMLHKDPKLAEAAMINQPSFFAALGECARLGLVPGDGYALVPFKDKNTQVPEVVGIVEYQGEIQMIYRTGQVAAVIAEVVHEHDKFDRGETPHEPPFFEPAGEKGFGTDAERGRAIGGFAYAVLTNGQTSRILYMSAEDILRRREVARTKNIWDGSFWKEMWLKTLVHGIFDWVPQSAAYARELMRTAAVQDGPAASSLPPPARQPSIEGVPRPAEPPQVPEPGEGKPQDE